MHPVVKVDESSGGKITIGLSIIVRVTLKDGTHHEVGYSFAGFHRFSPAYYIQQKITETSYRILAMVISKTANRKRQRSKRPRRKLQLTLSSGRCEILAMCLEIVFTTRTIFPASPK